MKYIILGAGPAGLAFANRLLQYGETSFIILEKEQKAGGLCRSEIVDGAALDIGGGHFLDVRRPQVNNFLFSFMPQDEWNLYERDSRINVNGKVIGHPLESHIWQFGIEEQIQYLISIANAGSNMKMPIPERFVDWIYWKLGKKIADDYMIPYNQKMFSENLDELGTYWLDKLPDVSFEQVLRSCLEKKAYGTQPGHAQFFYPKHYGAGELWQRMAEKVSEHIVYDVDIYHIDFNTRMVNYRWQGQNIISTIPWTCFKQMVGMPDKLRDKIQKLKYSSLQVEYVKQNLNTEAHWIYCPDMALPYHRILVRHNFLPNSKGYWTETNKERVVSVNSDNCFVNEYAYPLNTIEKPLVMSELLTWAKKKRVYGLGRWGEWQHYNSDVVVERAMQLAEKLYYE